MYVNQTLPVELLKLLDVMKYVSIGCVILNQKGEIMYINISASKIMKIKYLSKYMAINQNLKTNPQFFTVIQELLDEKVVSDMKIKLKCFDDSFTDINLNASIFYGLEDIFIVQFNEIKTFGLTEYSRKIYNTINSDILNIKSQIKKLFTLSNKNLYVDKL